MKYPDPTVPALAIVVLLVLTSIGLGQALLARSQVPASSSTPVDPQDLGARELAAARQSLSVGVGVAGDHASSCGAADTRPHACPLAASPSATPGSYRWTEYPSLPTGRTGSLMAYDSVDGYAVLFGGFECTPVVDCGGWLNDTWSFSHGIWTNLSTPSSIAPPSKLGAKMVWDEADGYVLLVTTSNTTWSFVGGVWAQVVTSTGPGARYLPGLTYDAADGYVVLFGGASLNSPVGQTWTYRAGVWTQLNISTSPWNRNSPAFTYDPAAGYSVLFGGSGIVSGSSVAFNDTWTFLAGNWTLLPNAHGPGQYRSFNVYGYDPLTSSIVAVMNPEYWTGNYLWEFAGGNWSQVTGVNQPSSLFDAGAYDPTDGEFLFVSGGSWFYWGAPNWISTFSLVNLTWAQIGTTPTIPSYPYPGYARLVDDPSSGGLLLTDGQTSLLYQNGTWSDQKVQSTTRGCVPGGLAYDAADGYVLLACGQTWKFQGGNWTQFVQYQSDAWPAGGIGVMAYDSTDGYVVLFGAGYRNETWTWSAGNWTNVTDWSVPAPTHRYGTSMVDDPIDGYLVLFGGQNATTPYDALNDTWTFAGGKWTLLVTNPAPSPREGPSMAFDALAGYIVLFGGETGNPYDVPPRDTWGFLGGAWTSVTPSLGPQPPGRSGALLGFDSASGQAVLVGGYSYFALPPSEWLWGPIPSPGAPSISSFRSLPAVTDVNVSVTLRATVAGGVLPFTYVYAGLPPGCTTRSSPTLDCRPGSSGLFPISLTVTDSTGNSSVGSLTVSVNPAPALVSVSVTPPSIQLGQTIGVDAVFSGGTAPFSFTISGLPPGCGASNLPVFSCVPSSAGNFTIRVSERDVVGLVANGSASLAVSSPPAVGSFQIVQFSVAPAGVAVGGTVVVSTTTSGGLSPLSFAYAGLPTGCASLDAPGFFCTPTQPGNFTIQVQASDSTPVHRFATALLLVVAVGGTTPPSAPRISSFVVSPSSVTLGGSVTFQVAASGGTPPYSYSYSGVLAGCTASDAPSFACVPTLSGQWAVGVTVTDSLGYFAQSITALTVSAQPSTPGPNAPGSNTPVTTAAPALLEAVLLVAVGILAGLLVAILVVVLLRRRAS